MYRPLLKRAEANARLQNRGSREKVNLTVCKSTVKMLRLFSIIDKIMPVESIP